MIKEYFQQIGIDRLSRLRSLYDIIQAHQVEMLFKTAKDNHSAQHTFKFKAMEGLLGLIGWNIDVTRFLYFELSGNKK